MGSGLCFGSRIDINDTRVNEAEWRKTKNFEFENFLRIMKCQALLGGSGRLKGD